MSCSDRRRDNSEEVKEKYILLGVIGAVFVARCPSCRQSVKRHALDLVLSSTTIPPTNS